MQMKHGPSVDVIWYKHGHGDFCCEVIAVRVSNTKKTLMNKKSVKKLKSNATRKMF